VIEKDEERIRAQINRVIETLSKLFPDASRASADLWKFAKVHDRRSYQLIRFAMAAVSDYRTVIKAVKELARRLQGSNNSPLLETLTPLLYRCSSLVFNRSHIPAIISLSRTDENGLASPAHEMLREISSRNPEVLEAQVQEMCKDLESQAPSAGTSNDAGTEEILKACSGFAKKLPAKLPKERKFFQALVNYALYSPSPRAAKHAVSILMATADRKEMYAKDLIQKCVSKWKYGTDRFLTKLATLSQLNLLAPREADEESDAIISIAVNQILLTNRSSQPEAGYTWSDTVDDETAAKEWALKIIVNRLRAKGGSDGESDFRAHAEPVYSTLNKLVVGEGELSKKKDTPAGQKSRLRLLAAKSILKLCASHGLCDQLLTPQDFNALALVAQDPLPPVRVGFINELKKKLVQSSRLSHRWYIITFLLAFEPNDSLKDSTLTWLKSRATFFSQQSGGKRNDTILESIFSRLLSLLAYHPDYPPQNLDEATKARDLTDFGRYILFYLSAIANEHNLSLIFHIAQRVKQARDGITKSDEITTRLHTLSDLAQSTIRRFADIYSQQRKFGGAAGSTNILQTYPGKMGLPSSIFAAMSSHREAQEVAEKNFLSEDIDDLLDWLVRSVMKSKSGSQGHAAKKRKPETTETTGQAGTTKKPKKATKEKVTRPRKSSGATASRTIKRKNNDEDGWSSDEGAAKATSTAARRRSNRGTLRRISYADRNSDEDDIDMDEGEQEEPDEDSDENENSHANNNNTVQDSEEDDGSALSSPPPSLPPSSPPPPSNKKAHPSATTQPSRRASRRG
jgi:sister-chromatid-cohesion protein PDS5